MTDPLDRFSTALAGAYDGQVAVPEVTRTRIAQGLIRRRKRRSGWRLVLAIPLFALVGGTALAATGRLPLTAFSPFAAWLEGDTGSSAQPAPPSRSDRRENVLSPSDVAETEVPGLSRPPASATPSSPAGAGEKTNVRSLADLVETEVPGLSRTSAPRSVDSHAPALRSDSSQGARSRAKPTQVAVSRAPRGEPALTTYAAAQRAQFREANCAAAVRLYADYLREAPSGALVVEARYNRSLCLIRLGRSAEARPILQAFARGDFGAYRKLESKRLLQATEKE
jgi:hypothetical protein